MPAIKRLQEEASHSLPVDDLKDSNGTFSRTKHDPVLYKPGNKDQETKVLSRRLRLTKNGRSVDRIGGIPQGSGTGKDPIRIPLRSEPNKSGCLHCPIGIETCDCIFFQQIIWNEIYSIGIKRRSGHRESNAKSILPVLVSRLASLMNIKKQDVFWDLGCGNGSVVMQVALQTGATVVGVDIQKENVDIAKLAWPAVCREWQQAHPDRKPGTCYFVASDMFEALNRSDLPTPTTCWAANLLFGSLLNYHLSERLISLPKLKAVCVMKDLYPRSRAYGMKRNPEPFLRFPRMEVHEWQPGSVEWSAHEIQTFCLYAR